MSFKKVSLSNAYANGVHRCPCCGVQLVWKAHTPNMQKNLATVDHIVPASMGGADHTGNVFVMCRECNNRRDTECFVTFVTRHGVSKTYAEDLYRKAHIVSLQAMIYVQFTQVTSNGHKATLKVNKRRRNQVRRIVANYAAYFGDYLPEFQLLQRLM